ncbi:hypothetical protein PENTCL1PPCAC_9713, partial [Pristionchus entomophagus]
RLRLRPQPLQHPRQQLLRCRPRPLLQMLDRSQLLQLRPPQQLSPPLASASSRSAARHRSQSSHRIAWALLRLQLQQPRGNW